MTLSTKIFTVHMEGCILHSLTYLFLVEAGFRTYIYPLVSKEPCEENCSLSCFITVIQKGLNMFINSKPLALDDIFSGRRILLSHWRENIFALLLSHSLLDTWYSVGYGIWGWLENFLERGKKESPSQWASLKVLPSSIHSLVKLSSTCPYQQQNWVSGAPQGLSRFENSSLLHFWFIWKLAHFLFSAIKIELLWLTLLILVILCGNSHLLQKKKKKKNEEGADSCI